MTYMVLVSYNDYHCSFCNFVPVPVNGTFGDFKWAICEILREEKVAFVTANELSFNTDSFCIDTICNNDNLYELVEAYNVVQVDVYYGNMLALKASKACMASKSCINIPFAKDPCDSSRVPAIERENTLVESHPFSATSLDFKDIEELPPAYSPRSSTPVNVQYSSSAIFTC
ncbi:hypothetical protein GGI25_001650 [Coemansia spiralis]|uniref:Uncharacterized protein n=2 Tax=Coemansia TaxID=4863 RepID=A0A9W8KZW1_9FUNG|nr:hypothetical protein EDC05_004753 [Coemansia umbellata]KAJ2623918.1 hypothetical protein GGI26_001933 [Coemansia sp. RSA 1358]KAJ2679294.1 hypothetical protein GGI25_001650 [Coemansia spiralis]